MNTKSFRVGLGIFLLLPLVGFAQTTKPSADGGNGGEWTPLFNGKNFDGWYTFLKDSGKNDDPKKIFQIDDGGVIHVYKDAEQGSQVPYGYLATEKEYGDCRIRLQYKWGEKRFGSRVNHVRDSGLLYFVWGEDGKGNGVWPFSIECQIQENDVGDTYAIGNSEASTQVVAQVDPATLSGKAPTWMNGAQAVPYTSPTTGNNRIVRSKMLEKDGWNTVEVEMLSNTSQHIVNGTCNMKLFNITRPDPNDPLKRQIIRKGRILIQAEGAEVMYRNIEVQPLK